MDFFRPLVAVAGPTASGKSALAMRLCEQLGGEIVSADSRQVYRYMDIGTDKPSHEDRARVRHHMIDIVDPDEPFSLGLYQDGAFQAIDDIHRRGRVPVLAGGTPLYVNALVEGWRMPRVEPDASFRARLYEEAEEYGPEALYERLMSLDPEAAAGILPTNTRRIIRALEVINATGEPISAQQRREPPPYRILQLLLECDRKVLYERIDLRVDSYITRGLVDEVKELLERGYSPELPSMSGIGYRQVYQFLSGRTTLPEAIQRIKWDTHAFVRHQINWFRRSQGALRLDVTSGPQFEAALSAAAAFLAIGAGTEPAV